MTHAWRMSLLLVLGLAGCTTASEADVAALGGALGQLNFAAAAPVQLPPGAIPRDAFPVQLCAGKPDVTVSSMRAASSVVGWMRVCTTVKNQGQAAWSSSAGQVAIQTSSPSVSDTSNAGGFTGLGTNSTLERCGWLKVPGLLRLGVDATPASNRCNANLDVTSALLFDPDIASDGNTANDDCIASNNKRTVNIAYVWNGSCPI